MARGDNNNNRTGGGRKSPFPPLRLVKDLPDSDDAAAPLSAKRHLDRWLRPYLAAAFNATRRRRRQKSSKTRKPTPMTNVSPSR